MLHLLSVFVMCSLIHVYVLCVTWAGFRTSVFPAAKQAALFHANIISG